MSADAWYRERQASRSATRSASPATSTSRHLMRSLDEIRADIVALESETEGLLDQLIEKAAL